MFEAATTGVTNVIGLVTTAFTAITGNEILCVFLGASLVTVALGVFRAMKGSVR